MAVRHLKGHVSWVQTVDALIAQSDTNIRIRTNDTNRLAHERFESKERHQSRRSYEAIHMSNKVNLYRRNPSDNCGYQPGRRKGQPRGKSGSKILTMSFFKTHP